MSQIFPVYVRALALCTLHLVNSCDCQLLSRTNITRKPSCRWQTHTTRKHTGTKNYSNSTCLQHCR